MATEESVDYNNNDVRKWGVGLSILSWELPTRRSGVFWLPLPPPKKNAKVTVSRFCLKRILYQRFGSFGNFKSLKHKNITLF